MTSGPLGAAAGLVNPDSPAAGADAYRVDVSESFEPFLARCAALCDRTASPFHSAAWLRPWYETLGRSGGRRPLLVGVRSLRSGADVVLLPLTSRQVAGASVVEFADASVVDYQQPIVSPHWAGTPEEARLLWAAVRTALAGHDVLRFDKMLGRSLDEAGAVPNPLMHVLRTADCEMYGNQMHAPGTWDEWRHSLPKRVRSEFGRLWRVFARSPQARFERITDPAVALTVFEQLETQQAARMHGVGAHYVLDQPAYRAFYRAALLAGLADGSVVLTALRDGEELVAGQYGVANGQRYVSLRLSTIADERWMNCSPGKLLLERTAHHLHGHGLRWFDFGIGAYAHKNVFGVSAIPLHDAIAALSWRGWPLVWAWRGRRALKRQAWLVRVVRRLRKQGEVHAPD
jgi:CelD/BcsL family acetyltransferase involved in cellulose biosynthesis